MNARAKVLSALLAAAACAALWIPLPLLAREIPVYPGARLTFERDPGEEPMCCDFITRDSYDKVLAFYAGAFKAKALDPAALGARFPHMKPQIEQMTRQMPAKMRIRFFVLSEVVVQGNKAAELFEVISTPEGVKFNITASQLGANDARFAAEWQEARAKESGGAAPKTLDPARLAAALPPTPAGFVRDDMPPETGAVPAVGVRLGKLLRKARGGADDMDQYLTVVVTIEDLVNNEEMRRSLTAIASPGERAVMVKGRYPGKESSTRNESGYETCEKVFLVADRFAVNIQCELTRDLALVNRIIDSMNLDALGK